MGRELLKIIGICENWTGVSYQLWAPCLQWNRWDLQNSNCEGKPEIFFPNWKLRKYWNQDCDIPGETVCQTVYETECSTEQKVHHSHLSFSCLELLGLHHFHNHNVSRFFRCTIWRKIPLSLSYWHLNLTIFLLDRCKRWRMTSLSLSYS